MFNIGDKIFYPMHGVGNIKSIQNKNFSGTDEVFFEIEFEMENGLLIYIKENEIDKMGIRDLVDKKKLDEVFEYLVEENLVTTKNWFKRYEQNIEKLKSTDIFDIAYIVKSLTIQSRKKKLSLRESRVLNTAKRILNSELSCVSGLSANKTSKIIDISLSI